MKNIMITIVLSGLAFYNLHAQNTAGQTDSVNSIVISWSIGSPVPSFPIAGNVNTASHNTSHRTIEPEKEMINPNLAEKKIVSENALWIYPNPVSDQLHLKFDKKDGPCHYQIIHISGKMMMEGSTDNTVSDYQIEVSQLPVGMYQIIVNAFGKLSKIKFVKY